MLSRMKWSSIAFSIVYIAAGVLLLLYPGQISEMFCDLFGIALIVYGIINIVVYFMIDIEESLYRDDFADGIVKILIGIMVIYHKALFQQIIPFLLAIAIIGSGFSKLQDGVDSARIGYPKWWQFLVLACISIVLGAVLLLNLIPAGDLMLQVAGAALLYSGLTDLYTTLYLSGKIRKYFKSLEKPEVMEPDIPETTAAYVNWNTSAEGMKAIREEEPVPAPVLPDSTTESSSEEPIEQ
ncbi:MAG: DUF308 domain-containing protein [Solobacterium sp.]|nr:DUF308 domain-containing protein [Solobacterium sp.]